MRVLIIGMGLSGNMFLEAFQSISKLYDEEVDIAYTARNKRDVTVPYYQSIPISLEEFEPDIVVVAVNDENHGDVLSQLEGFKGFVICEKPFVDPEFNLDSAKTILKDVSGFCLNMVARYSEAASLLKAYVEDHQLSLVRANFLWGKNRINDYRPTTGVISEVIHPLDLVQWINFGSKLNIKQIHGVKSDFSISGNDIPDSISVLGDVNGAVITGYSSFVNLFRRRELDFVFLDKDHNLIFAEISFDTPNWYEDSLLIWREAEEQREVLVKFNSLDQEFDGDRKIERISKVVKEVSDFVILGREPKYKFPDLKEAISLQRLLNQINASKDQFDSVQYNRIEKRLLLSEQSGFERLG
ncbi:Gfo/Idh/MocA family oxidoreductase [Rossellomorea sp. BNER]|uniref:Gfo/Idh/MocA family oxidoreductase n=1 Tax=Rossellomorea sp. BNER TaxID=2962031 RepID=UPI003AF2CB46|nr:Gfo/Idh/MocA family oxidoreductase [Rossellomorea sp. BNER]